MVVVDFAHVRDFAEASDERSRWFLALLYRTGLAGFFSCDTRPEGKAQEVLDVLHSAGKL